MSKYGIPLYVLSLIVSILLIQSVYVQEELSATQKQLNGARNEIILLNTKIDQKANTEELTVYVSEVNKKYYDMEQSFNEWRNYYKGLWGR